MGAADLLRGALLTRVGSSGAFNKIKSLLPIKLLKMGKAKTLSSLKFDAVSFEGPLTASFFVAERFLRSKNQVWGRWTIGSAE